MIQSSITPARLRGARGFLVCALAIAIVGCTQTQTFRPETKFQRVSETARVLLLKPDIELYELTAGGGLEPKAAWTEAAKANVDTALDAALRAKNARIVRYVPPEEGSERESRHLQLVKLHAAVGQSILVHGTVSGQALPTKRGKFDWTLGPGAAVLREDTDADYALFIHMRDSFSSGGRVAVIIFAAILGVGVEGGRQGGFASLVDLRNGAVVWFNTMVSSKGDLRNAEMAHDAIASLLDDFSPMSVIKTQAIAAMALLCAACATPVPDEDVRPGERPSLETDEAGLWMTMDRIEEKIRTSGRLVRDPELNAYAKAVLCKLAPEHCPDIRLYVVQAPAFNASMAPNGTMNIWTGMLLRADNEAQLAFILGHELGHYLRRHSLRAWRDARAKSDAFVFFQLAMAAAGYGFVNQYAALILRVRPESLCV